MTGRRIAEVYRDLSVCHQWEASLFRELASLTDANTARSDTKARRSPRIVRPAGESDDLSRRRAEQVLRRSGLVPR